MKRLCYILLVCVLFVACKSDDIDHLLSDRISSVEVKTVGGYGMATTEATYALKYDAAGRLKKINDKVFYYGASGRVEFSRIERKVKDKYRDEEYIERLSYHWDTQGRLKEVYVDSLYQKYKDTVESPVGNPYTESIVKDVLLATFRYEGTNRKPAFIRYRNIEQALEGPIVTLGIEEEAHYSYEDGNVASVEINGYLKQRQLEANPGVSLIPYKLEIVNTYLTNTNSIAKIYGQLGFHPYNFAEVASANSIATTRTNIDIKGGNQSDRTSLEGGDINRIDYETIGRETDDILPAFYGNTVNSYRFNALELPTEIVREGDGVMQQTIITYE